MNSLSLAQARPVVRLPTVGWPLPNPVSALEACGSDTWHCEGVRIISAAVSCAQAMWELGKAN